MQVNGHRFDPYEMSALFEKTHAGDLNQGLFCSVVDLDGTYAAGDPAVRDEVRTKLEQLGALIFCTARTPELVMSREAYELSKRAGFNRSEPKQFESDRVPYEKPLDETPRNQKDPDAILSFGEGIWLKAGKKFHLPGAYIADADYEARYLDPVSAGGRPWREMCMDVVKKIGLEPNLSPIDRGDANANVDPLKYRIQLDFFGEEAVEEKYKALSKISAHATGPLAGRLEGVDESNPMTNRATLYLMPPQARKENMINHELVNLRRLHRCDTRDLSGLVIGDTLTDFYAACYAGWDANFTGIIVGGSRLSECIQEKANFAGVDLQRMHSALIPTAREGYYKFINPLMRGGWMRSDSTRTVILGATAYPGTIGAETIKAYLDEHYPFLR